MKKIIALIVSVNYSDILEKVICHNLKIVDKCIIITTKNDYKTIEIVRKYNLMCIISNSCYDDNAPFNKSKMINIGLL